MPIHPKLTLSVIIPTLNRHHYVKGLLLTILEQTHPPDQLIFIDQSDNTLTKDLVFPLLEGTNIKVDYVLDSSFKNLVKAKKLGVTKATSDIITFLDDDSTLCLTYFEEIMQTFIANPQAMGCAGMASNNINYSKLYLLAHKIFYQGIFQDPRPSIKAKLTTFSPTLIPCDLLSGGSSAFRNKVLQTVAFDQNGLHYFEDSDFSLRAIDQYGAHFYLNTKARTEDLALEINNAAILVNPNHYSRLLQRKITDAFIFYKKHRNKKGALRGLVFILLWWSIEVIINSIRYKKISFFKELFTSIQQSMQIEVV